MTMTNSDEEWKRVEPTVSKKVGFRTIVSKTFVLPNGRTSIFDTVWPIGQEFVTVIALTMAKQVIVARQFRPGPERIMDDLPGGYVDDGEGHEAAMYRELLEETGYRAGEVTYLGMSHKDAYMNATWHIYFVTGCIYEKKQELDTDEFISVHEITIEQLIDNAKTNKMTDVPAVMMAYDRLKALQEEDI